MGKPAARVGDMHICPKAEPGPVPHVGGSVSQGSPDVFIGGMPAARVGDMATCIGPPDSISSGSTTVLINGKAAARMGDFCSHGGTLVMGCPTVLIGDKGGSGAAPILDEPADNWVELLYTHVDGQGVAGAKYTLYDAGSGAEVAKGVLNQFGYARTNLPVANTNLRVEFHSDPTKLELLNPTTPKKIAAPDGWLKRMMQGNNKDRSHD